MKLCLISRQILLDAWVFFVFFHLLGAPQTRRSPVGAAGLRMFCALASFLRRHLQMGGGQPDPRPARGLGHLPGPVTEPV